MVNFKPEELKVLQEKQEVQKPIYIKFNTAKSNLPPFLNWRAEQCLRCYRLYPDLWKENYNFIFEVYDYRIGETPFYNSIYVKLVADVNGEIIILSRFKNNNEPFWFFMDIRDCEKYFKRYYPDTKDINTYNITNDNEVDFQVTENLRKKTVTVKNTSELFPDSSFALSATSYCHSNDTYDFEKGLKIALQKWDEKWKIYFNERLEMSKKIDKIQKDIDKMQKRLDFQTQKNSKQGDKDNSMKTVTLTDTNNPNNSFTAVATSSSKVDFSRNSTTFIGSTFGDYVVDCMAYRDNSKHVFWKLSCCKCGHHIITTKSALKQGKVNVTCKNCHKDKESIQESKTELNDIRKKQDGEKQKDPPVEITKKFVLDLNNPVDKKKMDEIFNKEYLAEPYNNTSYLDDKSIPSMPLGEHMYVTYEEVVGDLFDAPVWSYIAHCIPADRSFGGKIAKTINERWNMGQKLKEHMTFLGSAVVVDNVINLIASERKFTKATLEDLTTCIQDMAEVAFNEDITMISMPKIGSGANGLNWGTVKTLIQDIFVNVYETCNQGEYEDTKKKIHLVVYKK